MYMIQEHEKSNLTKNAISSKDSFVYLHPEAYFKIIYHSLMYANKNRHKNDWLEVMGWLSGNVRRDKSNVFEVMNITKAWPITHGDTVSVKIGDYGKTLNKIIMKLSEQNETILGWYHSHPSFGLFMSQTDFETQISYQRLYDKAIAIVFDHTLWSSINSGLEAYRLLPDLQTFQILPIRFGNELSKQVNPLLYNLFMKKLDSQIGLEELETSNE